MIPRSGQGIGDIEHGGGYENGPIMIAGRNILRTITWGWKKKELQTANKVSDYLKVMEAARAMMDSPVKRAFDYQTEEKPEVIKNYEPEIAADDLLDKNYYHGQRFGHGLLLARRLVEKGARYIQVEYQYGPFKGFDMHENGRQRMEEMKKQIDRPIAQLIKDLDERGLLERTLVIISTEFGRTIASAPAAGKELERFRRETQHGRKFGSSKTSKCMGFTGISAVAIAWSCLAGGG